MTKLYEEILAAKASLLEKQAEYERIERAEITAIAVKLGWGIDVYDLNGNYFVAVNDRNPRAFIGPNRVKGGFICGVLGLGYDTLWPCTSSGGFLELTEDDFVTLCSEYLKTFDSPEACVKFLEGLKLWGD